MAIKKEAILLEHSNAKVDLFSTYFSTYLNILSRVSHVEAIHIYDLLCGEGVYKCGSKGSPIVLMEKIKDHYFSNNKSCPNIQIWLNDNGNSDIEPEKTKVERVKGIIIRMFKPHNVSVEYSENDFAELDPIIDSKLSGLHKHKNKALLFIDPYGYKDICPSDLKKYLGHGNTEIILFLPLSHMYRFASKALSEDDFPGGIPLKKFLEPLFLLNGNLKESRSVTDFAGELKIAFKSILDEHKIFVDTFTIERDSKNIYCLFFFTSNVLGFEKMLDAKWQLDENSGKGFKLSSQQQSLFSESVLSNYPEKLRGYISGGEEISNKDVYLFGLHNGFLPKHTNEVFRKWQNTDQRFKVLQENGDSARKGSFYLSYKNYTDSPDKRVFYKFE